jgi:hypothetical protein
MERVQLKCTSQSENMYLHSQSDRSGRVFSVRSSLFPVSSIKEQKVF